MGRVLTIVGGVLLVLSAVPHALLGWPPAAEQLLAAGVEAELIGGLALGWYFGSAAMLALGGAVLLSAPYVSAHHLVWRVPCCIGAVYLSFGVGALLSRSLDPHFLLWVVIGALLVIGSLWARPAASPQSGSDG